MLDSGNPDEDVSTDDSLVATTSSAVEAVVNEPGETGEATELEWDETTVEIPVTWTSLDYYPDTESEYVFTPAIGGYTVSAPPPPVLKWRKCCTTCWENSEKINLVFLDANKALRSKCLVCCISVSVWGMVQ